MVVTGRPGFDRVRYGMNAEAPTPGPNLPFHIRLTSSSPSSMSGLGTPPATQLTQDAGVTPTSHTTGLIRHEGYYDAGAPDPIFIQVCRQHHVHQVITLTGLACTFQVEDHLYRQSRHYLREHITFLKGLGDLPPPPDGHEGLTEAKPLCFPGVKNTTFEQLLSIIYLR